MSQPRRTVPLRSVTPAAPPTSVRPQRRTVPLRRTTVILPTSDDVRASRDHDSTPEVNNDSVKQPPEPVAPICPPQVAATAAPAQSRVIGQGRITPAERWDPEGGRLLQTLPSRCRASGLTSMGRVDPYWAGLWVNGAAANWIARSLADRQARSGIATLPRALTRDADAVAQTFFDGQDRASKIGTLGVLHGWRTATAEQIASFVGDPRLANPTGSILSRAFSANMVDLGLPASGMNRAPWTAPHLLVRPSKTSVVGAALRSGSTYAEWLAVTGGQEWVPGGQYDRHNLLATELGLRAAEHLPVATVLGERFSTVDLLAGSGVGLPALDDDLRSADLTLVREDGARIAVEITATTSRFFAQKVSRWAELLASTPYETSGLMVVFVVASDFASNPKRAAEVRIKTYEAILRAVRRHPGVSFDRVATRLGVATWREWFPAEHQASHLFQALSVDRPTGANLGAERTWESADLLSVEVNPLPPDTRDRLLAIAAGASMLAQTPHWLRQQQDAHALLAPLMGVLARADLPRPVAARSGREAVGLAVGAARGVSGAALPPDRLRPFGHGRPAQT